MNAKQFHTDLLAMAIALDHLSRLEPTALPRNILDEFESDTPPPDRKLNHTWWEYWDEVSQILTSVGGIETVANNKDPKDAPSERYLEIQADGDYATLSVFLYSEGNIKAIAEIEDSSVSPPIEAELFWGYLNRDYNSVEVGQKVTELFFSYLTSNGLSSAEALDYWGTKIRGHSPYSWGDRHGVPQQAITENVSRAKEKLGE